MGISPLKVLFRLIEMPPMTSSERRNPSPVGVIFFSPLFLPSGVIISRLLGEFLVTVISQKEARQFVNARCNRAPF